MKTFTRAWTLSIIVILALQGCQQSNSPPAAQTTTTRSSLASELGVDLPTQDEADAAAARAINNANADKAFEQLQREIESGG